MASDPPSPLLTSHELDYEEFDAALASLDGHTMLVGREKAPWRHDTLFLDGVTLQVTQEGAANVYEGEGVADHVTLGLGLPARTWIRANGVALDSSCLFVAHGGDTVASYTEDVCRYAALVVPVERFVESADHLDPAQTERLTGGSAHLRISPAAWQLLVDLVGRVLAAAASGAFSCRAAGQAVIEELIGSLVGAASSSSDRPQPTGRPRRSRQRIVSHIREFLGSPSDSAYSVAEMARDAGVCERTLRSVVHEHFGVGPKRLLMLRQLRDVRHALLRASAEETVSSIAASQGVWEVGRFAQHYRELFGEQPSTTLAAPRAGQGRFLADSAWTKV